MYGAYTTVNEGQGFEGCTHGQKADTKLLKIAEPYVV
jgi:hypothetical protein